MSNLMGVPTDITKWPSTANGHFNCELPNSQGIYVISGLNTEAIWLGYDSKPEIIYIGQTSNLKKRLSSHEILRDMRFEFGSFRISFMPLVNATTQELRQIEASFIRLLSPSINKQHNG